MGSPNLKMWSSGSKNMESILLLNLLLNLTVPESSSGSSHNLLLMLHL
jgi:hypothetical protein